MRIKGECSMTDEQIIELFFERSEQAISELDDKYKEHQRDQIDSYEHYKQESWLFLLALY